MSDYIERDLLLAEIKELKKSPWYNGGYGTYERNIRREAVDIIVPSYRCHDLKAKLSGR